MSKTAPKPPMTIVAVLVAVGVPMADGLPLTIPMEVTASTPPLIDVEPL